MPSGLRKGRSFLVGFIVFTMSVFIITDLFSVTRDDQTGYIDIKQSSAAAMGFTADDQLITTSVTLLKSYVSNAAADFVTNRDGVTNNNWCERDTDSVDPAKNSISNSELSGMWVTWDTNFLYIAIRGQAQGRHNNIMCLVDSNSDTGYSDFNLLTHNNAWKRDILFDEGILPNVYFGFWCTDNHPYYNGTDGGGNTKMFYGDGLNDWVEAQQMASQTGTNQTFYAWYNGSSQSVASQRVWGLKLHWAIITNRKFVSDLANLEIRLAVASTGPDDGSLMYDYMPETQYAIKQGVQNTIQNNYFKIYPFDASGNIRIGVNPRETSGVNFYPGSRWDVANFPDGQVPIKLYNDSGNQVKAFSPNGDGVNDTINMSFTLTSRGLVRCSLKIFDLKGRLIRTLFSAKSFLLPTGWPSISFNGVGSDPNPQVDSSLVWDGRDDNSNYVPMGIYVAVFEGEDGSVRLLSRKSIVVLR